LVIIGAKGLAKELLQVLVQNGTTQNLIFFDNISTDVPARLFSRYRIIRSFEDLQQYFKLNDCSFALGVGGGKTRYCLYNKVSSLGGSIKSIISKHSLIGPYGTRIGEGSCVLANTIIECDAKIGVGCLINNGAIVSHDTSIGNFCEISPGAKVLGRAKIGHFSEIGANAVILPKYYCWRKLQSGCWSGCDKKYSRQHYCNGHSCKTKRMLKLDCPGIAGDSIS